MSLLNAAEIMEILPHRYPFLLIDTVEEMEAGVSAIATKCVTINEPFFTGHFPGNPVMPGVLILEALAQTGAVSMLSKPEYKGKTAYFAGMDKVRFKKKVVPGDVLTLKSVIISQKGTIGKAEAKAYVGDELAASCEMMFSIG